jgi:LSD1 subclass zinc finger protein
MRRTHFTAELRILLCEHCGAPLELPVGGGQASCSYCQAVNVVAVRDERRTLGLPASSPVDEGERLRRLRMQDGRPLLPPPALAALVPGGRIEPWRRDEVLTVFQQTRKELKTTHSPDAAERLYFLTLVLANHLGETNDLARLRAVLETSLDALSLPRHRQSLRGMLARNAVREGDLAAAERWLAPCDPRSDDLETDTAFRVTRAMLDTARGDLRAVLATLGTSEADVPIMDSMDASATVLRANAREKSGDLEGAVAHLRTRMAAGRSARDAIEAFIRLAPGLRLCEASLPRATAGHTEAAAKAAGSGTKLFGLVFLVAGLGLLLLAGVLMFAVGAGGALLEQLLAGRLASLDISLLMRDTISLGLGPGLAGIVFVLVGGNALRRGITEERLMRTGVPGFGVVIAVESTGVRINKVPLWRIRLRVERDGHAPYEGQIQKTAYPGTLAVGMRFPLKIDPADPQRMTIDGG